MVTTFISLLGSLAQANFVWNGDIVLNVAMAGGGVDWLGLLGLAIIILQVVKRSLKAQKRSRYFS